MRARALLPVFAAALALPALAAPAGATMRAMPMPTPTPSVTATSTPTPTEDADPVYLSANLSGLAEVPSPGGPEVGDPRGTAKGAVEIDGDTAVFTLTWRNLEAPTAVHVHRGRAGVNGPVVVPLLVSALPRGTTAVAGVAVVDDPVLVEQLRTDPGGFYLNLHTARFPGGAVRGQLRAERHGVDPLDLLGTLPLEADMIGENEVPGPGDPDGYAFGTVKASGNTVRYALAWIGIAPAAAHLHEGAAGTSGPMRVPLFLTPAPRNVFLLAGEVAGLDRDVRAGLRGNPEGYYLNLHTELFPAGAVRGQLGLFGTG